MNPLRLTLKGFIGIRSGMGRDAITLDLAGSGSLVTIVGANGKGKTTILDNLHPYRLMPSRATSYTPGGFSYYDHTYGAALKCLRWKHGRRVYESSIVIKNSGKTKSQECYLHEVIGDTLRPAQIGALISDGKSATYDTLIDTILGSAELYFTAAFACQGRRTLADYANADVKALMADLLGLDAIRALGGKATDVARAARIRLDAIRGRVERRAQVLMESEAVRIEHGIADEKTTALIKARIEAISAARDADQRFAEARVVHAMATENERRRKALIDRMDDLSRRETDALTELTSGFDERDKQVVRTESAARAEQGRAQAQISTLKQAIGTAERLMGCRRAMEEAEAKLWIFEEARCIAVEAVVNAEKTLDMARAATAEATVAREAVALIDREGKTLGASYAALKARAALIDAVPCQGTDLQSRCPLLAEANAAAATISSKEAELDHKRASRIEAVARLRVAEEAVGMAGDAHAALQQAKQGLTDLDARMREAQLVAAQRAAIEAAEARIVADRAALETALRDEQDASNRVVECKAISLEIAETKAAKLATLAAAFSADRSSLLEELAALPAVDTTAMNAARFLAEEATARVSRIDAETDHMRAILATLMERIRSLRQEEEALMEDAVRASRLDIEIAQWTLLGRALGNDGIIALSIDDAGPAITAFANDLLMACYGPRFSVKIQTQRETAKGDLKETFDIHVLDAERGDSKSIRDVSGGERVYINEAMTRAIALYQAQNSGRHYECLFADESDGALDQEKKRQFAAMKRRVLELGGYEREIYISHSRDVQEAADVIIDLESLE